MAAPMTRSIFSWGANSYGQLGHGNCDDCLIPTEIHKLTIVPRRIVAGGGHTFFLCDDNSVRSCGWNSMGQLAQQEQKNVPHPLLVPTFQELDCAVTDVSCGWDFTLACFDGGNRDGSLHVWGSNTFGQLGLPSDTVRKFTAFPLPLPLPDRVISVAAGMRHTVAVTATGCVYTWGMGKKGQLGIMVSSANGSAVMPKQHLPSCVHLDNATAVKAVAGAYHSACLTASGTVYVWGDNKHGQMALDRTSASCLPRPQMISPEYFGQRKVVDLYSGWTHMLAVLDDGSVFSWGRNDYGQLGRPTDEHSDYVPKKIDSISSPKQISCGSEHNLLLSSDNQVWAWGWNEHGICGTGNEGNVMEPTVINYLLSLKVVGIGCGMGHSFAITEDKAI